ncbi:hypothetical protein DLX71_15005 [Escherichia coli]|nr:hypothetical protein [Escherichia coli]EFO3122559.1 hypothetical protein [Escherichia coli O73]EAA1987129.1 hypothetical protein [Escherichia coli]EFO0728387.1 hypothetical protein [Escherichia coli]EFO0933114.1 hypothetical protein [Escherichia coli]
MYVSTTFNLLCSKRIAGRFCASRNIFSRHFVTLLTSPRLIVKVCNKGESQYNPRPNVCKRERNRLRK